MDILELPAIPRDRDKLRAVIGQARAAKRQRNLTRWAALNTCCWGLFILMQRGGGAPPPARAVAVPFQDRTNALFIPSVMRYSINDIQESDR
jgi:hypothetical protein